MREAPVTEPFVVGPGEGLSVTNPVGGVTRFTATAETSGGAITALEGIAAPGEGPPLQVHRDQDELAYTLEGRFRFRLGDALHDAPVGSFVFIPRGAPHTWQNVGDAPARFVAALMPAAPSFERFFDRFAALPPDERGPGAFARLAADVPALEVVGPPLAASHPLPGRPAG
jgi:quercetin dioxygenase-like cupin family protein